MLNYILIKKGCGLYVFYNVLKLIIGFLYINVFDKVMTSLYSRYYAKKCNYDCSKCGNWACVNGTEHENDFMPFGICDNYRNVCGKEKLNK